MMDGKSRVLRHDVLLVPKPQLWERGLGSSSFPRHNTLELASNWFPSESLGTSQTGGLVQGDRLILLDDYRYFTKIVNVFQNKSIIAKSSLGVSLSIWVTMIKPASLAP